jgi:hypothetical protein
MSHADIATKVGFLEYRVHRILRQAMTSCMLSEHLSTSGSMQMMTVVNAPEQAEKDWIDVIQRADSRYYVEAVVTPPGTAMSIIKIMFNASSYS